MTRNSLRNIVTVNMLFLGFYLSPPKRCATTKQRLPLLSALASQPKETEEATASRAAAKDATVGAAAAAFHHFERTSNNEDRELISADDVLSLCLLYLAGKTRG